ncbi:MerR family transcriptional regulator [Arthrobacter sp. TMN-49]
MSVTSTAVIEPQLLDLRDISALGYGTTQTIRTRIHRGEVPAVLVGNRFKIRREDLHHLAKPVGPARSSAEDDLNALFKRIVEEFPRLSANQKAELGQLLASACQ